LIYKHGRGFGLPEVIGEMPILPRFLPVCLLLLALLAAGSLSALYAQSNRKVIHTQPPDYPIILKSKGIGGTVRLRAKVLANGTVSDIDVLGGNPVLAASASKAVITWKFAPASTTTNEIVTFNFTPTSTGP
jgi:TonB family protein